MQLDSRKNQIHRACSPDFDDRDYFSETLDRPPDRSPPLSRVLSPAGDFSGKISSEFRGISDAPPLAIKPRPLHPRLERTRARKRNNASTRYIFHERRLLVASWGGGRANRRADEISAESLTLVNGPDVLRSRNYREWPRSKYYSRGGSGQGRESMRHADLADRSLARPRKEERREQEVTSSRTSVPSPDSRLVARLDKNSL